MEATSVKANGLNIPLAEACSVEAFLLAHGQLPRSVVVELNGEAIAPSQFASSVIRPGDSIEIVRIVAGG